MTEAVWSIDGIILMVNTEVLRGTPVPLTLCPSQIAHELGLHSANRLAWQLIASATAWPVSLYHTLLNANESAASVTWLNEKWRSHNAIWTDLAISN
jgi:hypothetical protein